MFIKAPALHYFDLQYYIQIQSIAFGNAISAAFNQLTLNDLDQQYLLFYFLKKKFLAKTSYKTQNSEFLPIIKAFKI